MKVILCGVLIEDNFGGPSLLRGIENLIYNIDENAEIIFYHNTKVEDYLKEGMNFEILLTPYKSVSKLLLATILYKFGVKPKKEQEKLFFSNIKSADYVVDLFGICFCSKFSKKRQSKIMSMKTAIGKFSIAYVAKLFKVKTIKAPASYGPIDTKVSRNQAKFTMKHIFDYMIAREKESLIQLLSVDKSLKNKLFYCPDLANLFDIKEKSIIKNKKIVISVSYQICNQWSSNEPYQKCMINLIKHILKEHKKEIILLPNETFKSLKKSDIDIAKEIYEKLTKEEKKNVLVYDDSKINSYKIKKIINDGEILIASRYHSCVAGLSSGIPTLVIGWHYKYVELLELYNQDKWLLSSENCTSKNIITLFDDILKEKDEIAINLKTKKQEVIKKIYSIGEKVLKK